MIVAGDEVSDRQGIESADVGPQNPPQKCNQFTPQDTRLSTGFLSSLSHFCFISTFHQTFSIQHIQMHFIQARRGNDYEALSGSLMAFNRLLLPSILGLGIAP